MRLMFSYAAGVLLALLLSSGPVNAQDQSAPSAEQPQRAQQAASSMTEEQQSVAKKAFCSALAGQYNDAASAGASALASPKVFLTAAKNYSSAMHVPVSNARILLKEFATKHASDILSSCAVSNPAGAASSALPAP